MTLRSCSICRAVSGDLVGGKKIAILGSGICNGCQDALHRLEDIYRRDFERRTETKIELVIPWPAIKQFSWPPRGSVMLSGWAVDLREFAIALAGEHLVGGRRSYESWRSENLERIAALEAEKDQGDAKAKIGRDSELDELKRSLAKAEKRKGSTAEHPLFSLALERVGDWKVREKGQYLDITFSFRMLVDGFRGASKEKVERHFLLVSKEYAAAIDVIGERLRELEAKASASGFGA